MSISQGELLKARVRKGLAGWQASGSAIGLAVALLAGSPALADCTGAVAVCDQSVPGAFALVSNGQPATVYVDATAPRPVLRVAEDFADDLERVSGRRPAVVHDLKGVTNDVVVIATHGRSALIDSLTNQRRVDFRDIGGQWEAYQQLVVSLDNGHQALLVLGSDVRGAIYGTYDISAKMGVSPWYWWADVPVAHKDNISITGGVRADKPVVKYRGFFINDEEPAFGGWAREKFGGINSKLYAKVFELDLRLKGNYLWPAMWGKAIAADDPESLKVADDYGVVLGTSHHEPMTRAQDEWHRNTDQGVTGGKWDYTKNADNLRIFWRGGMERAKDHEYLVTVGMRGDGDEPMTEGTATHLLEQVVSDQRQIITEVTRKPADQTPQVWALYKEVQDYYDHGMQVPDDITLLFSDDNWGQIRRLPDPRKKRAGGYGIYYHFDYVGGPRNYKWINTNQIEKTWQQMELARESGADRLWIVNVGDIKPMEFPLSFFLDMAWNPDAMTPAALKAYPQKWARQQFGSKYAGEIGSILTRQGQYASRRKPELLNADMFAAFSDLSGATLGYTVLSLKAEATAAKLPTSAQDAWFQLVQYPVAANANLYGLYDDVARNRSLAAKGDAAANDEATAARWAFSRDGQLREQYHTLADGKWDHMMDQAHIGYSGWQQPDTDAIPALQTIEGKPGEIVLSRQAGISFGPGKRKVKTSSYRYVERNRAVAVEAEHYARKVDGAGVKWTTIPNLGRSLSSVLTLPQTAPASSVKDGVRLEYDIKLVKATDATLNLYLAPTLDTAGKGGLKLAVAVDNLPPQVLTFDLIPDKPDWTKAVSDNVLVLSAPFKGLKAGQHTLKIYRIDGNVVIERLVLDTGGLKPSYLGPPESPAVP